MVKPVWPFSLLGEGLAITQGKSGYTYVYDPKDLSIGLHMLWHGEHEPWLHELLATMLCPGDLVVDVGTNIGYHAVRMCDLVGPVGHVWCCEPNDRLHKYIHRNLILNGFGGIGEIVAKAISDSSGEVAKLYLLNDDCGGSALQVADCNVSKVVGRDDVTTQTVDNILDGKPAALLKVDAEGSEAAVLRGARRSSIVSIIIENNPNYWSEDLEIEVDHLRACGYSCSLLGDGITGQPYDGRMQNLQPCDVLFQRN